MMKIKIEEGNYKANMEDDGECFEEEKDERVDWNKDQDYCLRCFVEKYGSHNWIAIAECMNETFKDKKKSSKQCRERWCSKIDPAINHSAWTKQEEALLMLQHIKYKNKWRDISGAFKGRNNLMVKNRFYTIFRKIKNKVKTNDLSIASKLEHLEIAYILSIMEEYIGKPVPAESSKLKRGKDFMYSLIEDIKSDEFNQYKSALHRDHPLKTTLEIGFREVIDGSNAMASRHPQVMSIAMPLQEPMEQVKPLKPINMIPALTPISVPSTKSSHILLPQPKSFQIKETLTADEKETFKHVLFCNRTTQMPTSAASVPISSIRLSQSPYSVSPMLYRSPPMSTASMSARVNGGFEDYSYLRDVGAPKYGYWQGAKLPPQFSGKLDPSSMN